MGKIKIFFAKPQRCCVFPEFEKSAKIEVKNSENGSCAFPGAHVPQDFFQKVSLWPKCLQNVKEVQKVDAAGLEKWLRSQNTF